jgi:adenylate cyclase
MSVIAELKRRNVHRMAGLYLVGAWLAVQVAEALFPLFGFDETPVRITVIVLAIGFVPALVFAWVFELTPEGLKRESEIDRTQPVTPAIGRSVDRLIMALLALGLGYFAFDKFVLTPRREAAQERENAEQLEAAHKAGRTEALVESYGDRSIAVLPFVNMSNDPEQEYFSDGMAEELLNLLTQVPQLRVISRSSAFSFKGQNVEVGEIARRLDVAHVLEGSVRKMGNKVRITAQLIDARTDTHLWSQTWDRELGDIFLVQDEVAAAVVGHLKLTLLAEAPRAMAVAPQAYALYLQARQVYRLGTAEGVVQSIELYQQALALAPGYAPAWTGLSHCYARQGDLGLGAREESYRRAREAADKALTLDPDYAPAYDVLGWIAMIYDGDLATAARHYGRALALAPADTDILRGAAALAGNLDRLELAIALDEYVVARDPVNPSGHNNLGADYFYAGRLDEAIASWRAAQRLAPGRIGLHSNIGEALMLKGQPDVALAEIQQESNEEWRLADLPMAYHALGRGAESDAALAELIGKYAKDTAYNIAYVLAYRGEADRAFDWLDKAVAYQDPGLTDIAVQPLFANIRKDPRWLPFLRKLGKAPEQLAAIPFEVKLPQ